MVYEKKEFKQSEITLLINIFLKDLELLFLRVVKVSQESQKNEEND